MDTKDMVIGFAEIFQDKKISSLHGCEIPIVNTLVGAGYLQIKRGVLRCTDFTKLERKRIWENLGTLLGKDYA